MSLTTEGVLALAPDESSAKAARGLMSPTQWPSLGANEAAAWGECKGSGAKPYQTQVDLSGPAFRCSCPSRKFPCKHGLALLLMRAQDPTRFSATEPPAWVTEWLASRGERAQKKEERDLKAVERAAERVAERVAAHEALAAGGEHAAGEDARLDPGLRRETQRWQRIEEAAVELRRWLGDQVARGLGALDEATVQSWRTTAARLVDAQAPGLGQRVLAAARLWRDGPDWPERLLAQLGLLQLAAEALSRRATLDPATQADLRTLCGWPIEQAEVLAVGERVTDRWAVLGAVIEEREGRLMERRVWLRAESDGRRAWLLDHAYGGRGFEGAWMPGTVVAASLVFHPGAAPLRALALPTAGEGASDAPGAAPAAPSAMSWRSLRTDTSGAAPADGGDPLRAHCWADEWREVARRVAANPFVTLHPVVLRGAALSIEESGPRLHAEGRALEAALGEDDRWRLLAVTGGRPCAITGEWDGRRVRPLAAWREWAEAGDGPAEPRCG